MTGRITLAILAERFCAREDITIRELRGRSKRFNLANLRRRFIVEARETTGRSTTQIGIFLDNRDHSTISHAIKYERMRSAALIYQGAR
jgi:chromosomal replication initiation ATPase DnaA